MTGKLTHPHRLIKPLIMKAKINTNIYWIVFIIVSFNVLLFTYYNAIPFVKSDGWRFVNIYLEPWYENSLGLIDLFKDHHPQPVTAVLFILNAELFGLRMDYEALLGAAFVIINAYIFIRYFEKFNHNPVVIITIIFVLMGMISTNVYTWSLVTIGYIGSAILLIIILYIDKLVKKTYIEKKHISILSILLLTYMLLYADSAIISVLSILFVLSIVALFKRNNNLILIIGALIAILIVHKIIFHLMGVGSAYTINTAFGSLKRIFFYPIEFVEYIGISLLSSMFDISHVRNSMYVSQELIALFGVLSLLIYAIATYLFFKMKMYEKSYLPAILIFIGILTSLAAWIYRYIPETQDPISANIPRYYRIYAFSLSGLIWILAEYIYRTTKRTKTLYFYIFLTVLLSSNIYSIAHAWHYSKYIRHSIITTANILIANANGDYKVQIPKYMVGGNYPDAYKKGIKILMQHKLNIFHDKEKILRKYK